MLKSAADSVGMLMSTWHDDDDDEERSRRWEDVFEFAEEVMGTSSTFCHPLNGMFC